MALNANQIPVYGITPKTSVGILASAGAGSMGSTTNAVTVVTAGSNGCIVDSLVLNSTSAAIHNIFVFIVDNATPTPNVKPLGIVNVPANSGNQLNVVNVDAISPSVLVGMTVDQNGKRIIRLAPSETLRVSSLAAITGNIYATAQYTDL